MSTPSAIIAPVSPAPPKSPVKWAFHGKEGTPEELTALVQASEAPAYAKAYLCAIIGSTEGRALRLTSIGASDHPGELTEHTRVAKIY